MTRYGDLVDLDSDVKLWWCIWNCMNGSVRQQVYDELRTYIGADFDVCVSRGAAILCTASEFLSVYLERSPGFENVLCDRFGIQI